MEHSEFREVIERVREQTDIVQVIGERVPLDTHGKGLCPFHEDTNPSLQVHREGQYFHCFGCGAGGDVFKFVELYEKKPFLEVLTEMAEEARVPLSVPVGQAAEVIRETRLTQDILIEAARFYHRALDQRQSKIRSATIRIPVW